jgi:hypothetical protein
MIKSKSEYDVERVIDLTGPDGNAFALMGYATRYGSQMGLDVPALMTEMRSGDYENLVAVFDREFGLIFTLLR